MTACLEVRTPSGDEPVPLEADRVTMGPLGSTTVPLPHDKAVSGVHAVPERVGAGWCVQDLGSRNGTLVLGERILGMRALRHGDEVAVGRTRPVFRLAEPAERTRTEGAVPAPDLTRRERNVLRALCRPLFGGRMLPEPASLQEIAAARVITQAAVEQHLLRLYDEFGVAAGTGSRRRQRANEAIRRGAVTLVHLRGASP